MVTLKLKLFMAAVLVSALVAAYFSGRLHGQYIEKLDAATKWAETESAYSDALTKLASAVAEADAAAAEQRGKAQTLSRQVTRLRNEKLAALPPAGCTVPDDRRVLIGTTYCSRFPAHPACMSGELRAVPDSTPGAQ